MKKLTSRELRKLYFDFFKKHEHTLIAGSSLIPENDPTVLFTTAGMHPLVPYLLGEEHSGGKRLVNVQKCIRTGDIDEVGDASHLTFFEMLGNWSLGDYFKEEAIKMSYEFLTSPEYLNIPKEKLYFTVFGGADGIPKDEETYNIWKSIGIEDDHLFYFGKKENFWILGSGIGPCGPDTEMFYDTGKDKCSDKCNPACNCGKYLEIWNDVFMQYYADGKGNYTTLNQQNVDTGMGLERTVQVLNGLDSVYDTDLFINCRYELENISNLKYEDNLISFSVILDHMRAATFILGDDIGLTPSNIGQGYVLRRLIRRVIRHLKKLNVEEHVLPTLAKVIIEDYKDVYPELERNKEFIFEQLEKEETNFNKTLKSGEKLFYRVIKKIGGNILPGNEAFKLFDTFGFPLEMTIELAKENNIIVDEKGFHEAFKIHQEKSKTTDAGSFKGGLADDSYETTKYHTLTHIVLVSLKEMFGDQVQQKGSNITSERLRFDFNLDHKMTDEEKEHLTELVNKKIQSNAPVTFEIMTVEEADALGAEGVFKDRYQEKVKVYTIEGISTEICGGPHVKNTSELGTFKIEKEESSGSGIRRLRATLK